MLRHLQRMRRWWMTKDAYSRKISLCPLPDKENLKSEIIVSYIYYLGIALEHLENQHFLCGNYGVRNC